MLTRSSGTSTKEGDEMAIYRNVQLSFWTDNKVQDEFTPEDKYFYLYLLTNPQTNICGCYEISYKQMTYQTGYNKDTIERLLKRFDEDHMVIKYSENTKEILVLNWYKYNWNKSPKMVAAVQNVAKRIKNPHFQKYVLDMIENVKNDRVSIGYPYPMDTSVTVYINTTGDNTGIDKRKTKGDIDTGIYREIVDYLNLCTDSHYRDTTKSIRESINGRLKEGFTVDDFKTVIDKKCHEWKGTDMEQFLRPSTLFAPSHFQEYLNQPMSRKKVGIESINWDEV